MSDVKRYIFTGGGMDEAFNPQPDDYLYVSADDYNAQEARIAQLEAVLREAIAQMESDAVFYEYDRGHRRISEIPDEDLPDALLHARAALAPKVPT